MAIDRQTYDKTISRTSPSSKLGINMGKAFLIGGAICALGQGVHDLWLTAGLSETAAGAATSAALIFLGALLTGLNIYDKIAKHGGAGTLVPITGFANSMSAPAIEFKAEGLITGLAAKMFIIAGPVLVYGTTAAVLYGAIYWVTTLI